MWRVFTAHLFGLTVLLGCWATAVSAEEQVVRVTVSRDGATQWQVQYLLPYPVTAVQFRRGAGLKREQTWQLLNPELRFRSGQEGVQIRAHNGKPFAAFTVRFPEQAFFLNRDYTFHVTNADGSLFLFTGQLYVDLLIAEGSERSTGDISFTPHQLLLTPLPSESVLIDGLQAKSRVSWLDRDGEGTYAYFGNATRQKTENGYTIVDMAAPHWARQLIAEFVPQLFAHYRERFGFAPQAKPTVTLSYQPHPNLSSFNGGRLADIIQLSIQGEQYAQRSDKAVADLRQLLAHEAAHFWQWAVLAPNSDAQHHDAWVHEGGADAAAFRALFELGLMTESAYHATHLQALNQCVRQLQGIQLADAFKQQRGKAYYDCGAALSYVLEQHMQRRGMPFSVFEQWQAMYRQQQQQLQQDNSKLFFSMVANSAVEPALQQAVPRYIEQTHADSMADMKQLLSAAALEPTLDSQQATANAHFEQARRWMFALMAKDCAGSVSFSSNYVDGVASFSVDGLPHCQQLKTALQVRALAGVALTAPDLDLRLRQQCTQSGTVAVAGVAATSATATFQLACPESLPDPLQWLVLAEPAVTSQR
ncbi:MAG: hypothetical protein ACK4E7_01720 [Permianibacter sp.]